jgi:hypothetical protein
MIPFPKMHIAQSVLNRISNALEEDSPLGVGAKQQEPVALQLPPIAPDPTQLGMELDSAVAQPIQPAAVEPGMETDANNGMLEASAMGASPFSGALLGA